MRVNVDGSSKMERAEVIIDVLEVECQLSRHEVEHM